MDLNQYKREVEGPWDVLVAASGCRVVAGSCIEASGPYHWTVKQCLIFPDDHYVRMAEHWKRIPGTRDSRRHRFVYHYGPIPKRADGSLNLNPKGMVVYGSKDAVVIRIDETCGNNVHLHYLSPKPHFFANQIEGGVLSVNAVTFLDAVVKHRTSAKPLTEILGFRIK